MYLSWQRPDFRLRAGTNDEPEDKYMILHFTATLLIPFIGIWFTGLSWWSLIWIPFFIWGYGNAYIDLPIVWIKETRDGDPYEWGFYFYGETSNPFKVFDTIWIKKGATYKCFHMPWEYDWYRSSHLKKDGKSWEHEFSGSKKDFWNKSKWQDVLFKETHPYIYTLKSGAIQERNATIGVSEMEWRWRAFKWLPWPRKINRSINVEFDHEVGERTGSWKGGTLGCGYTLKKGEEPWECLARMEREREFD